MNTPHVLRVNELARRAAALGTDVAHIIALDASVERARQGEESNARRA